VKTHEWGAHERAFVFMVILCAVVFASLSVDHARGHFVRVVEETSAAPGSAGTPRDADLSGIRRMIEQGQLSDHEALFYAPVPAAGEP